MNNNMYTNPYIYSNPYYAQQNYYGQQHYQQPSYQQPMQVQQQAPQTNYMPLTFVNGIEGAKAFIVPANSVVYLKDSDSTILFEKKADQQGKYSLIAYNLVPIKDINNIKNEISTSNAPTNSNGLSKDDLGAFVTKSEFKAFERDFFNEIDKLSHLVEKTRGGARNNEKRGNE